jgi:hypothetical protein
VLALIVAVILSIPPRAEARYESDRPASDWIDPERFPGMRGILELEGEHVHNCGNLLLHVTNFGLIGSTPGLNFPWDSAPSAQWPSGSATEYLWQASLWIGAIQEGEPHVTTGQFPFFEFRPGLSELDRIYETRELAPGGARRPSPNADDDRDGQEDEDWLDGRDNDDDGLIDEDFAAISNQMFFCEYSDVDPSIKLANPEHVPLGFRVQQSTMCWEDPLLDDFIAFDYRLIHEGFEPLLDVYVGFYADCDIGVREREQVSQDDWAGFWEGFQTARLGESFKTIKLSVGYMFDDDGDEGQADGYIGLLFLGAQDPGSTRPGGFVSLRNFRMFSGRAAFDQGGDPGNDEERYQILDGSAPLSLPPPADDGATRPARIARAADDYRMVVSSGPFGRRLGNTEFKTVEPGDSLRFQSALVIGLGFGGMLANAVQAQLTYDGVWLDCDDDPLTGVSDRESPVCGSAFGGVPFPVGATWPDGELPTAANVEWCAAYSECAGQPPSNPACWVTPRADECGWINADCRLEEQTGFRTGIDGKECNIHWLVSTAPPPPRMRLVASENRVDVLWDNFSEITPDLRLNVIDFESYRIWRADNWTRPLGTDRNTGPGSELWMLLQEFDLPKNDIGSDTGLESIRYTPNVSARAVEFYREWFTQHPFLEPPDLPGLSSAQLDTAKSMAQGVRYYRFTDPPFQNSGCHDPDGDCVTGPCPMDRACAPIQTATGPVATRCNRAGMCQEVAPPAHGGAHYFYAVTATDHRLRIGASGQLEASGPGLAGDPSSNFVYLNPPSDALPSELFHEAEKEIFVVPNPATRESMRAWMLQPNNEDPTGIKIEFQHLPRARGKVTVFTLAGDMVIELPFDGRGGNGSLPWNLVSRNGQEVTSGVYLYAVEAERFERFVSRFVVIR